MKKYRLLSALLIIIFLAGLSGVQGQQYSSGYPVTMPSSVAATSTVSQDAQFYSTPLNPPANRISAPIQINNAGLPPLNVMLGSQGQSVPYGQFLSNPANAGNSYLWIKGITSWTQHAVVPQGSIVQLIAVPPTAGNGILYLVDTDGQLYPNNYYFFPYSQLTFFADKPGQHVLYFTVNGKVSNTAIIDVTATYTPPNNYLPPRYNPYYYPYYYSYNLPGFFRSVSFEVEHERHGERDHGEESEKGDHKEDHKGDHGGESEKEDHKGDSDKDDHSGESGKGDHK